LKTSEPKQRKRTKHDATMHIGVGAVELVKQGAARYDFSDPYHIAIELSWKGFALAFVGLELGINIAFALLYLASPGCVANMRRGSFSDAFFFSIETLAPWVMEPWLRRRSTVTPSQRLKSFAAWSSPRL
jgi:inward rectifier potassium channel